MATEPVVPAVSAPPVAPSAPAPETSPLGGSDGIEERLTSALGKAREAVSQENPEAAPVTPEVIAPAEEAKPEVVEAAPPEVAKEPEAAKPAEEAKPVEEVPDLDDGTSYAPADFAKDIKGTPVEQWLNEHPELRGQIFSALRLAPTAREILQYVPTVEAAKTATEAAATYQGIDNHFLSAVHEDGSVNPEGINGFLESWAKQALITDDKGQPVLDNGQYKFHPALDAIFSHIGSNRIQYIGSQIPKLGKLPAEVMPLLDGIEALGKQSGDERLQSAMEILREVLSPPSPGSENLPPELKSLADSLKKREEGLNERESAQGRSQREQREASAQQSIDRAESKVSDSIKGQLQPQFAKSQLSDFEKQAALERIGELLDTRLAQNSFYKSVRDSLVSQLRRTPSEAAEKALREHDLAHYSAILGPIAAQVMREAKGGALSRQAARDSKREGQRNDSRTEPQGTSVTPTKASSGPITNEQLKAEYRAAHNGEEPTTEWVITEALKRARRPSA